MFLQDLALYVHEAFQIGNFEKVLRPPEIVNYEQMFHRHKVVFLPRTATNNPFEPAIDHLNLEIALAQRHVDLSRHLDLCGKRKAMKIQWCPITSKKKNTQ